MREQTESGAPRRILVALDRSDNALEALHVAAGLAAERNAELVGVFVEDPELLHAASHPFSRALGTQSLVWQSLDAAAMKRAFRAYAGQLRAAVAAAARARGLPWSFHVAHGAIEERVLEQARGVELIALGRTSRPVSGSVPLGGTARRTVLHATCSVLVLQRRIGMRRPVTVLYEGSRDALAAGRELARAHDTSLEVLVLAREQATGLELETRARAWMRDRGAKGHVEVASQLALDALAARVSSSRSRLAVIDMSGPVLGDLAVDALLDRLDVPAYVSR